MKEGQNDPREDLHSLQIEDMRSHRSKAMTVIGCLLTSITVEVNNDDCSFSPTACSDTNAEYEKNSIQQRISKSLCFYLNQLLVNNLYDSIS